MGKTKYRTITVIVGCALALGAGCGDDDGGIEADAYVAPDGAGVVAASCALADVRSAIAAADVAETVAVPPGDCTWDEELDLSQPVHLRGAGTGITTIRLGATVWLTKHPSESIELSGFTFLGAGAQPLFQVTGDPAAAPPLIHDNLFEVSGSTVINYGTNGGIIYDNTFRGDWDDGGIQHKLNEDLANTEWDAPDTLGENDTDGTRNLYVEDNFFFGMSNGNTDFDDGARVVFRYNELTDACVNSHGLATSPVGVRHLELYGNDFLYPDDTVNQNWWIWLRGGTGVIYDNHFDDLVGQMWGDKAELHLSVRAIHDVLCCTTYPCSHQIGQSHDGSAEFTDPLYLWNNTGTLGLDLSTWPDDCGNGQDLADYLQEGRDFILATAAKPGYTPYPYPHPLRR